LDPEEDLDENLVESEMKAVLDEGEFDDIDPNKRKLMIKSGRVDLYQFELSA